MSTELWLHAHTFVHPLRGVARTWGRMYRVFLKAWCKKEEEEEVIRWAKGGWEHRFVPLRRRRSGTRRCLNGTVCYSTRILSLVSIFSNTMPLLPRTKFIACRFHGLTRLLLVSRTRRGNCRRSSGERSVLTERRTRSYTGTTLCIKGACMCREQNFEINS